MKQCQYVQDYFSIIPVSNSEQRAELRAKEQFLLKFLKQQPMIWGIAHIPVLLGMLCYNWRINNDNSYYNFEIQISSLTNVYQKLQQNLQYYLSKRGSAAHNYIRAVNMGNILDNNHPLICFLECLALNAMKSYEIILPISLIDQTFLEIGITASECQHAFLELLRDCGFLCFGQVIVSGSMILPQEAYFFHLSVQEFFAAQGWIRLFSSADERVKQKALDYLTSYKKEPRFEFIWRFVSGLLYTKYSNKLSLFFEELLGSDIQNWDDNKLQFAIACLHEGNINHSWCNKTDILQLIANKLYHLIISSPYNTCEAKEFFDYLSYYQNVSLEISYQGVKGFNSIALLAVRNIMKLGSMDAIIKVINAVYALPEARGLTQSQLNEWLVLALEFIKNKIRLGSSHLHGELPMTLLGVGRILLNLNTKQSFNYFLDTMELITHELFKNGGYLYRFFVICKIFIEKLTDEQICRILNFTLKNLNNIPKQFSKTDDDVFAAFYEMMESLLKKASLAIPLNNWQTILMQIFELLVNHTQWQVRYKAARLSTNIVFEPSFDDNYFEIMTKFSQDEDVAIQRIFVKLIETHHNFVARNWERMKNLLSSLLLNEKDVGVRSQVIAILNSNQYVTILKSGESLSDNLDESLSKRRETKFGL